MTVLSLSRVIAKIASQFCDEAARCRFDCLDELISEKRCHIDRDDGPIEDVTQHPILPNMGAVK
jgi:hypothetical protein